MIYYMMLCDITFHYLLSDSTLLTSAVCIEDRLLSQDLADCRGLVAATKGLLVEDWQRAESVGRMACWDDLQAVLTLDVAPRNRLSEASK